jgi:hypothetical protein
VVSRRPPISINIVIADDSSEPQEIADTVDNEPEEIADSANPEFLRNLVQRWYDAWHFDNIDELRGIYDDTRKLDWIKHEDA